MKLIITALTIMFISFGANAKLKKQRLNLYFEEVPLINCMAAKANSTKPFYVTKAPYYYYSHKGYLFRLSSFGFFMGSKKEYAYGYCERTKKKIF